jgi:hypothetical protein
MGPRLEAAVAALTPGQVTAATISIVKAGDFQKAGAYK